MAHHHGAAREAVQALLQGTYRVDIHIVGRFIQQEHIPLVLERERQVQPVPFAAGQDAAFLFLVGPAEIKARHPGTRIDVPVPQPHPLGVARNGLVHGFIRIDGTMLLVHVGQFHRLANFDAAAVGLFDAHNQPEQGGLARAVRADNAHDACRRQDEAEVLEEKFVSVGLANIMEFNDFIAKMRAVGDIDFQVGFLLFHIGRGHLLVSAQTGFLLGLAGLRGHPDPFQLAFQGLAPLALLLLFHGKAFGLLVQPGGIIPLPGNALAAVQFQDPAGHVVQEVTVMRNGNHRTLILLQMGFQPLDGFGIQVVGGLVQQEDIGLTQQQAAEGHPAPFTARKGCDRCIRRRALEGIHRPFQFGIDFPSAHMLDLFRELTLPFDERVHAVIVHRLHESCRDLVVLGQQVHHLLNPFLNHFQHGFGRIHLRFLLQVADTVARRPDHLSLVGFLNPGDDFQERGFTRAVQTDDADLGPVEERQIDILEDNLVVVREDLAHPVHGENDFFVSHTLVDLYKYTLNVRIHKIIWLFAKNVLHL